MVHKYLNITVQVLESHILIIKKINYIEHTTIKEYLVFVILFPTTVLHVIIMIEILAERVSLMHESCDVLFLSLTIDVCLTFGVFLNIVVTLLLGRIKKCTLYFLSTGMENKYYS